MSDDRLHAKFWHLNFVGWTSGVGQGWRGYTARMGNGFWGVEELIAETE